MPLSNTFWLWIERLSLHGVMSGYQCGGQGEPCDPQNRPYFRPNSTITRGSFAKSIAQAAGFSETPGGQTFAHEVFALLHSGVSNTLAALGLIQLALVALVGAALVMFGRDKRPG